ncbi:MAG: TatD family hydrolase [Pirellulales bacterium]|nr:TatD family hydrolase [Pirellulales bacterium]
MLIDTHAHLDDERFEPDRDEVLARARAAGVVGVVAPAVSLASSRRAVALAQRHSGVHAAVGIQPNACAEAAPGDWDGVVALVGQPRVVALGETGLDRHWDYTPFDVQQDFFDRHLRLAQSQDLPVVIHSRDCDEDTLDMLRQARSRGPLAGVIHSFSGSSDMADECFAMGLYVSFSGSVTYTNRKFESLRRVAAAAPADRFLVETDSPYLVPQPLRGRADRNEPAHLVHTLAALAALRGCAPDDLARQTTANAVALFGLCGPLGGVS